MLIKTNLLLQKAQIVRYNTTESYKSLYQLPTSQVIQLFGPLALKGNFQSHQILKTVWVQHPDWDATLQEYWTDELQNDDGRCAWFCDRYMLLHYADLGYLLLEPILRHWKDNWYGLKMKLGAHGCTVGRGTVLQARRSQVRFPVVSPEFWNWYNPSGCTISLGNHI